MLFTNFIALFLESAPWLILGLILAGMLKVFVPMSWMQKQLGGHGFKSTIKAALLGAPLPLCSCGVIPAAVGLRRSGASKAATTSFLISTPETGVDSIAISYVLLGPFMAIVRPLTAIISAITAGLLVGQENHSDSTQTQIKNSSCCSNNQAISSNKCTSSNVSKNGNKPTSSCCGTDKMPQKKTITTRISDGLHFAATDLLKDTSGWLLIGLFFAALVQTYVPIDFLAKWGDGILAMLAMVIISIPMYICATASTPIAAGLLLAGISPGAVLVFMLAGPATNIATLGVVSSELGKRALWGYLAGVIGVALLSGIIVNYLVATCGFVVTPQIGAESSLLPKWMINIAGIILAILMGKVLFDMLRVKSLRKIV
ncbi:SO_0444 family Cu/Zn efflux transporter [Psychromonas sp. MME1]|uniref:SO_0444 family Cu/Zn efflux transporter n=1 Tax=Psychromonas sp. MME1 TaxID=3231032 RepID=UPI0034E2C772